MVEGRVMEVVLLGEEREWFRWSDGEGEEREHQREQGRDIPLPRAFYFVVDLYSPSTGRK